MYSDNCFHQIFQQVPHPRRQTDIRGATSMKPKSYFNTCSSRRVSRTIKKVLNLMVFIYQPGTRSIMNLKRNYPPSIQVEACTWPSTLKQIRREGGVSGHLVAACDYYSAGFYVSDLNFNKGSLVFIIYFDNQVFPCRRRMKRNEITPILNY